MQLISSTQYIIISNRSLLFYRFKNNASCSLSQHFLFHLSCRCGALADVLFAVVVPLVISHSCVVVVQAVSGVCCACSSIVRAHCLFGLGQPWISRRSLFLICLLPSSILVLMCSWFSHTLPSAVLTWYFGGILPCYHKCVLPLCHLLTHSTSRDMRICLNCVLSALCGSA